MLPKGWSLKKLEELASVERGKFSVRPRNDPRYFGGNIPFVQTGDIAAAKTYLRSYTQTLNEDGLAVSRSFPKNTILITIAANIGDTAITTFDVACPDSLVAIQPKKDIDIFWLNSYLETCKDELDGKATQNAQKNINLQVLRPLEIVTPPPKEQRKIAQILSTWDKAITTTEKLIASSQQQKKALMQQLLTGKKRFAGFSDEWEKSHLSQITNISMGSSPKSSAYNELGEGLPLLQGNADIKNRKSVPRVYTTQITKECFVDDILLSVRAPVGSIAKSFHHACIGQ
jgi:type I restriction enzyme S subunit